MTITLSVPFLILLQRCSRTKAMTTILYRGNDKGEILDASGQVIGRVVPVTDGDNANDRGARVLREVYSLCEDTQDKCAIPDANDFNRGRAFEAKGIARAMGAWYQSEFCGKAFMGEPSISTVDLSAAAVRVPERRTQSEDERYHQDAHYECGLTDGFNECLDALGVKP